MATPGLSRRQQLIYRRCKELMTQPGRSDPLPHAPALSWVALFHPAPCSLHQRLPVRLTGHAAPLGTGVIPSGQVSQMRPHTGTAPGSTGGISVHTVPAEVPGVRVLDGYSRLSSHYLISQTAFSAGPQ